MYTERHVVTCVLCSQGRILVLKRSRQVGTYQERWSGVSGPVSDDPLAQAFRELHEETGLLPADVTLVRRAAPIEFVEEERRMRWRVHPFLFRVDEACTVQLGWEHEAYRWIDPRQLHHYQTVPMLAESLDRLWDMAELGPQVGIVRSQDPDRQGESHSEVIQLPPPSSGFPTILDAAEASPEALEEAEDQRDANSSDPEQHASEGQQVRVKVLRNVTTTGEFPHPGTELLQDEEGQLPPCFTGAELAQDPRLAPLLDALPEAPHQNPSVLLQQALEVLIRAGERSAAPDTSAWMNDLRRIARTIVRLRPSLPLLAHTCVVLLYELEGELERKADRAALQALLETRAASAVHAEAEAGNRAADQLSRLISPGNTVMTLGYSLGLLDALQRTRHFGLRVIVGEGRPTYAGRLMARAVLTQGRSATLIIDAAMGLHLSEADMVVLSGDGLLINGGVIARVGAGPLALAARAQKKPLYIISTLRHLDLRPDAHEKLVLEEKEPGEVWSERMAGLDVRNVAFEVIPRDFITALVCEDGLIDPANLSWEAKSRDHLMDTLRALEVPPRIGRRTL